MRRVDDLLALTEARLQNRQANLRGILKDETELRQKLRALTQAQSDARIGYDDFSTRILGADLLWQGWVARQREALHAQLANTLVAKADAVAHVGSAFGKHQAIKRLGHTDRETRRKTQQESETLRLLDTVYATYHSNRN